MMSGEPRNPSAELPTPVAIKSQNGVSETLFVRRVELNEGVGLDSVWPLRLRDGKELDEEAGSETDNDIDDVNVELELSNVRDNDIR